jgi:hypothetical protein
MKKQTIKQNNILPPPSPALIRQLHLMGYVITNDHILIKVPTKENMKR